MEELKQVQREPKHAPRSVAVHNVRVCVCVCVCPSVGEGYLCSPNKTAA
jgi:hypothetical protein